MNTVSYIRVSSRGQLDGDGPRRQRVAVHQYCLIHKLTNVKEFFEKGVSGTVGGYDREAFSEMIDYLKNNKIDGVVVERLDRLARDLMESEFLIRELRKLGIKLFSADQPTLVDMASDEGDPTRKLIRQVMGALAEWEKSQIVRKLQAARQRKKAAGFHVEGTKPYGTLALEKTVLAIMREKRKGGWGSYRISIFLNNAGLTKRNGKAWTRQAVWDILHNQGTK